jgi:TPR repeat protein
MPAREKTQREIQGFIEDLNAKTGQFPSFPRTGDGTSGVIRLPAEAEWEYAARGGAGPDYKAVDPYKGDVERHEVFFTPGSGGLAREVATFPPNSLGLHDMLGNVREFVEGSYSVAGRVGGLLLKGGSYTSEKSEIRSSARNEQTRFGKGGKPSRRPDAGCRLCISADVFTSFGQAQDVLDKLKGTNGREPIADINLEEALKLDAKRKQFDADAESAKQERQKLAASELEKRRKEAELAEQRAKEEREKLAALKKSLESPPPEPSAPPKTPAPVAREAVTPAPVDRETVAREVEGDQFEQLVAKAEGGDEDATFKVAMAYFNGWPAEQNWSEAAKWFAILAGNQNAKAILNLGIILWEQSSPIRDTQKAAQLFLEAAKRNEPEAVVFLSECVRYGFTGKDPDPKAAIRILLAAAQEKNLFAVDSLAWCLLEGSPELPQSEPKAAALFREAWAAGHSPSAHALGFIYRNGRGVPIDMVRAREYYRLAAQGGYAPAQNTYARFLAAGTGGDKNEQEAIKWFSEAAKNGDKNAKSNLRERGICLL